MLGVTEVEADDPADQLLREYGREIGADDELRQDARRRVLRRAGRHRAGPLLRRRRARARRLHRVRALHGRLPAQRQEHAAQELPLAGRARRARRSSPSARSSTCGRSARPTAPRATRSRRSGPARGCGATADAAGARRRDRRGRARHQQAAVPLQARRLAAARLGPPRPLRAHQLRGDPRRHAAEGPHGPDQARRDHLERLSRPGHAHRDGHLRRRRRLDEPALHADGRRRHARDAAAEAARHDRAPPAAAAAHDLPARLVAAHDHRARACRRSTTRSRSCPSATSRGGIRLQTQQDPERPNPTFIPVANHFAAWLARAHGRDRAELGHGGGAQHAEHRPHPRRRRDRRRPLTRRGRRPPARVRLREPARLRRLGDPRQRRREPEPDHHRAGRARDRATSPRRALSPPTSRRARTSRTPRGSA